MREWGRKGLSPTIERKIKIVPSERQNSKGVFLFSFLHINYMEKHVRKQTILPLCNALPFGMVKDSGGCEHESSFAEANNHQTELRMNTGALWSGCALQ